MQLPHKFFCILKYILVLVSEAKAYVIKMIIAYYYVSELDYGVTLIRIGLYIITYL